MPVYPFKCTACEKYYEMTMKMSEHAVLKDTLTCQECHEPLVQLVSRLNFRLVGEGWFPAQSDEYNTEWHGIDQGEFKKNLELEKKIEDVAMNMADKEPK